MKYKKLSKPKQKLITREYSSGTKIDELSRKYKVPKSTIYSWVSKYGNISNKYNKYSNITARDYTMLLRRANGLSMRVEILQNILKSQDFTLQRKFQLMEPLYGKYPLRTLCDAMQVDHASFYNHMVNNKKDAGWKFVYREKIKNAIQELIAEDSHIYGATVIVEKLKRKSIKTSRRFVSELMHELGIDGSKSKKYEYMKEITNLKRTKRLIENFETSAPNAVWLSDCTQCFIRDRKVWVCAVLDLYSRKLLAIRVSRNNSTRLTSETMAEAIDERHPKNVILHTDQGANYTSYRFNRFLVKHNITHSYSRSGMPKDNAPMESFFKTYKNLEIWSRDVPTYEGLKKRLGEFKATYNSKPHSHLKYLTPDEYENKWFLENSKNNRDR